MASARDEAVNRLGQLVRPRSTSRFVGLLVSALLLGLVGMHGLGPVPAGGAGSGHDPMPVAAPTGGDHNAADVSFSKEMIQHHRQAVEMAGLAADHASSAQVKSLATKIKGAQAPEIKTMSGWLTSWGEQVPRTCPAWTPAWATTCRPRRPA
jgi:uncharacterized protein (DUF305 family)